MRSSRSVAALSFLAGIAFLVAGIFADRYQVPLFVAATLGFTVTIITLRRR
jgi:hypothetical protein